MKSYTVEFVTSAYVSIPVEADTREEAEAVADKMLTRHSVWAECSVRLPALTAVSIDGKGWAINRDIGDD